MALKIETIDDGETVSRLIDFPSMYAQDRSALALGLIFTFPNSEDESVVWRKYKPTDAELHALGCERELDKRQVKPAARYKGFSSATAGVIRSYKSRKGHGFSVQHAPEEGIHHASVRYRPKSNQPLTKSEKTELKVWLGNLFSTITPHICPDIAAG